MTAPYILLAFGAIFLLLAFARLMGDQLRLRPQSRTWLIVALIFIAVASWLLMGRAQGNVARYMEIKDGRR